MSSAVSCWRCSSSLETGVSHQCGAAKPSPVRARLDEALQHLDAACTALRAGAADCEAHTEVPGSLGHAQELRRFGQQIQVSAGQLRERALRA